MSLAHGPGAFALRRLRPVGLALLLALAACGSGADSGADTGEPDLAGADVAGPGAAPADAAGIDVGPSDAGGGDAARTDTAAPPLPVPDVEAAARAFRLYYRERVERAVVAYHRFLLFGDVGFGATVGKAGVARNGDAFEVVAGPNDNNQIGMSVWTTWNAYRIFGGRTLELSLIRMFEGLAFIEAVSGHPGLTARMALPGWTRTVDGVAGTVQRLRDGAVVTAPDAVDPALEAELLDTFWAGARFTYREDPSDFLLSYMPATEVGPYATTYGFSMLPAYLRVSDCCTSLVHTPPPYPWAGAYWSNHNSRDNLPDLGIGLVVAREAAQTEGIDAQLLAAAVHAVAAGQRIGDSVAAHGGRLMTVGEYDPGASESYATLVVAGGVRPDGETESEDLGSLSDCQMAYLARALSSEGLGLPLPELPLPGSLEKLLDDIFGGLFGDRAVCPVPEGVRTCTRLEEAYCGADWGTIEDLEIGGTPWLDLVQQMEDASPGMAEMLIGSFQDDFHEKNIAMLALIDYARVVGDDALLEQTRTALSHMTDLMRRYADLIFSNTAPERRVERYYDAALFDAAGGLEVSLADLNDFARAESQIAHLESLLHMEDTAPAPLLSDEEIRDRVASHLAGRSDTVRARYRDAYGDSPPVRRAGEGYEARVWHPDAPEAPWRPVERPHHRVVGGVRLLEAIPLCTTAPELLDCAWARLGCARPDLDGSGAVDDADQALFAAAQAAHGDGACDAGNGWCDGADLDRTGRLDDSDTAFLAAAAGCHYDPVARELR